jgi:magnesium-transporting ATPase (P-type)
MFFFEVPSINSDNYILHKGTIFVTLFMFNYVVNIIKKMRNGCQIIQKDILSNSATMAVAGLLGYTLFVDFKVMEWSRDAISSSYDSLFMLYLIVTIIMTLFISLIKIIQLLFNSGNDQCIKV